MSDLSDIAAVQNLVGSRDGKIDIRQLLHERDLVRQFSIDARGAGSCQPRSLEVATAKSSVRQANEKLFVLTPPTAKPPVIRQFKTEQEFEGTVVAINQQEDTFTARLADLTGISPDEEGEFSLSELNGDQSLVLPGAIFTWTIGLQTRGPTRQSVRVSDIRFRRLPSVSQQAIAKAEAEAHELSQFLHEMESTGPLIARL